MSQSCIYGIHAISKRLERSPESCVELICSEGRNPRLLSIIDLARQCGLTVRFESKQVLDKLSDSQKHQGCVLKIIASTGKALTLEELIQNIQDRSLILVLDGLQDPHNLGACLRSADASGVDAVIIPKDRSVKLNPTVRKVAAGAAETVPLLEVTNIARCLKELKSAGVWVYGASGEAEALVYDFKFDSAVALVMGSEGDGLRRLTREQCDHLMRLPMHGALESLNVSVATGVCLYEILRSRMACSQA
ncbi:MAG: 23S rRNA (guanosine(2251)-2'-O)-methyltransferase RlmB [Gammaproteobacteria bacterium]|nr:23S rRNA (guanosine(2251)-2'-O)-methyltransferase RlmB [Gammaproteobacteria bacterium]MCZ6578674.1 23S rRNA (guanosine(2251)-2'-O)-methyltransferase RlmB [Gammaproteobacteria bacterium]MCZ6724255.1 23S rRNA (guanosine(2251)-2'-O)-methyltransferase RlmB [Gammaproteobacteria bacterium]